LTDIGAVRALYHELRPEIVIHLAGVTGGIGSNRRLPATFFYTNAIMGLQLLEEARSAAVEKFVAVGTICSYPKMTPVPFHEEALWNGYPEETNAPYGLAKKMLLVQGRAYREQYGFSSIHLLPVNMYGPRDNFDFETSHVIPAIVRKCLEAVARGDDRIVAWGDGTATRDFLYVQDAAEAILLATERYDDPNPVNVGSGREVSIRDLAGLIAGLTGFRGHIEWDATQPNGQPRRVVDTTKAEQLFGFKASTVLEEGLAATVAWYRSAMSAGAVGAPTFTN
jgi:GDP-L-fucose synthase